jgi:phosphoenolpyruvate carboxykinase (ATP)
MLKEPDLGYLKVKPGKIFYQTGPQQLTALALENGEGILSSNGALSVHTGKFTGRSPLDRFIVYDDITRERVCWNEINIPFLAENFDKLYAGMIAYLMDKEIYVRDASVCAEKKYRLSLRLISETAYQSLFAYNLFLREESSMAEQPEWTIIAVPDFEADPVEMGTRQSNFTVISFSRKLVLIGGTGYTGEIKKAVFSILNFLLPAKNVLPMHCAANRGEKGDTSIFFGLSGTGKTTLSADPSRHLIGDDEHGWGNDSVFNFEGGCYAKVAGLDSLKEPFIYHAIREGALLENVVFAEGSNEPDFNALSITENTRVSYPMYHVEGAEVPSIGDPPDHIFFLTADAFGVLPPVSRLSRAQAMYHFISGYTCKIAGTEEGINEPKATFSACFGKAFLPLHPIEYARLLGEKIHDKRVTIWLINTGWTGGSYGTGRRIDLRYTRSIVRAAMEGHLDHPAYKKHPVFGLMMPGYCEGVPSGILDPSLSWDDPAAYERNAVGLARLFDENFKQYEDYADDELKAAALLFHSGYRNA